MSRCLLLVVRCVVGRCCVNRLGCICVGVATDLVALCCSSAASWVGGVSFVSQQSAVARRPLDGAHRSEWATASTPADAALSLCDCGARRLESRGRGLVRFSDGAPRILADVRRGLCQSNIPHRPVNTFCETDSVVGCHPDLRNTSGRRCRKIRGFGLEIAGLLCCPRPTQLARSWTPSPHSPSFVQVLGGNPRSLFSMPTPNEWY